MSNYSFDYHNFCITKQDKFHYYLLVDAIIFILVYQNFHECCQIRTIYLDYPILHIGVHIKTYHNLVAINCDILQYSIMLYDERNGSL